MLIVIWNTPQLICGRTEFQKQMRGTFGRTSKIIGFSSPVGKSQKYADNRPHAGKFKNSARFQLWRNRILESHGQRAYSWASWQMLTMAILNTGVSAESIGLGVSSSTAKSFGFCFYAGQDKTKTKRFWLSRGGKAVSCSPALSIAEPLCASWKPRTIEKNDLHNYSDFTNNRNSIIWIYGF